MVCKHCHEHITKKAAAFPQCNFNTMRFKVGGTYIHGDNLERLMEVSADGILQCAQGDTQ